MDKNGLEVMKFSTEFNDVLELEYEGMELYIQSASPEVRKIASNFTTRLLKILIKMSVLCSVAQSRSIAKRRPLPSDGLQCPSSRYHRATMLYDTCGLVGTKPKS